jgi:two-component system, NarL family, response regulator NreC
MRIQAQKLRSSPAEARHRPDPSPAAVRPTSEAGGSKKIRILLCDDHTLFREGIRAILSSDPSLEIAGEAEDGKRAVEEALRILPDVILMDVSMPALIGYEAIRQILRSEPKMKILVLTMYEEEEIIRRCLKAGASGYLVKDAPAAHLLEAVHRVHEGGQYLSPRVLKKVVTEYTEDTSLPGTRYDTLSDREREVLKLLAEGYSVKEIAAKLNLSVKTAEAHKYNLMRKLDLHDRTGLIKYALGKKLIHFPNLD